METVAAIGASRTSNAPMSEPSPFDAIGTVAFSIGRVNLR
jgi:hypothetical protein